MSAITQIQELLEQSDYSAVRELCQQLLSTQPCDYAYWYWGLAELLHDNYDTAREVWIEGMSQYDPQQLIAILAETAKKLEDREIYNQAGVIYFNLYDLCPENLNYLLLAIYCGIKAKTISSEVYQELSLIEKLQDATNCLTIDYENITKFVRTFVKSPLVDQLPEIVDSCYQRIIDSDAYINFLTEIAAYLANSHLTRKIGIKLIEQCRIWQPSSLAVLSRAAYMYVQDYQYAKSEIYANRALELATSLLDRICTTYYCLVGIANSGHQHDKMRELILKQLVNMQELIAEPPDLNLFHISQIFIALFHYPYVFDQPRENHQIQNAISKYCEERVLHSNKNKISAVARKTAQNWLFVSVFLFTLSGDFGTISISKS